MHEYKHSSNTGKDWKLHMLSPQVICSHGNVIIKYADDTYLIVPAVNSDNSM